jgi:16S rRNA C1402 (ribose-2'-O) methylase RsmI
VSSLKHTSSEITTRELSGITRELVVKRQKRLEREQRTDKLVGEEVILVVNRDPNVVRAVGRKRIVLLPKRVRASGLDHL